MADKQEIYLFRLPADCGFEVTEDVIGKNTGNDWLLALYDEVDNRLLIQNAVMVLDM